MVDISVSLLYSEPIIDNSNSDVIINRDNETVTCVIPSIWSKPIAKIRNKS